jgi:hypothetical protein
MSAFMSLLRWNIKEAHSLLILTMTISKAFYAPTNAARPLALSSLRNQGTLNERKQALIVIGSFAPSGLYHSKWD